MTKKEAEVLETLGLHNWFECDVEMLGTTSKYRVCTLCNRLEFSAPIDSSETWIESAFNNSHERNAFTFEFDKLRIQIQDKTKIDVAGKPKYAEVKKTS